MIKKLTGLFAVALAALACNAPLMSVETLVVTEETPTMTEAPPTDPAPTETAAPTVPPTCALPGGVPIEEPLPTGVDLPPYIEEYLAAGGSPEQLEDALRGAEMITDEYGHFDARTDFDGDGVADVLVLARNMALDPLLGGAGLPPGDLMLYTCRGTEHALTYQSGSLTQEELFFMPVLVSSTDLTANGTADLLFYDGLCGAHTCYNTLHGLRWDGASFASLFDEPFNGPYPSFSIAQRDDDDPIEIVVDGGGIGSVGAGPQRTFQTVYDWTGEIYEVAEVTQTSPSFPIHVVMDADDLFDAGEYADAIAAYERSYTDEDLASFEGDPYPLRGLEAYARYRILLAHLAQGNQETAEEVYRGMQADFAENDAETGEFLRFARLVINAETLEAGCQAVISSMGEDWQIDTTLNQFGYANKYYEPQDVCPF